MLRKMMAVLFAGSLLAMSNAWASEDAPAATADPSCLYFAHPMNVYNTPLEKKLLARIQRKFPRMHILNPNEPQYREGWGQYQNLYGNPMLYYSMELMPSCTGGIIALSYRNGRWSPGVYREMMEMYVVGRPTWRIDLRGRIREVKHFPPGLLSIKENKGYAHKPY